MTKVRPFNKEAYDTIDKPSKLALMEMMETKGYSLVGNIDEESYKKWDLQFVKGEKLVSFELEMRRDFGTIKKYFKTIHIPVRKANNQSDWYIIWNLDFNEFATIETNKIREYSKDNLVQIDCNEGSDLNYTELFIDIPKEEFKFYKKCGNGKFEIETVITEIITEEIRNNRIKELFSKKNNK